MYSHFIAGKARFVSVFGEIFDDGWKGNIYQDNGLPSGADAATWLFDRFTHHNWRKNRQAPNLIINELHIPILHAAIVRSLRTCGRVDLIEKHMESSYNLWFFTKCITERAKKKDIDPQLVNRFKDLATASQWNDSPFLKNILNRLGTSASSMIKDEAPKHTQTKAPPLAVHRVRYEDIIQSLTEISFYFNPKSPFVLDELNADECAHLVQLLDPRNDYVYVAATSKPAVRFVRSGYTVDGGHTDKTSDRRDLRSILRPAVVVANKFNLPIPWHRNLLIHDKRSEYAHGFINCLVACDDSSRFYEELRQNEDLLMPYIGDAKRAWPILKYVDSRMIPFLRQYARSSTDTLLGALCLLARQIDAPEIDFVISELFYRWTQRFDSSSPQVQHNENDPLWSAFYCLAGHRRFEFIQGWETHLLAVIQSNIPLYHKKNLVRALERSPRAYVHIESMLSRTADFEHSFEDEADRLDEAANKLFNQILEEE